MTQKLKRRVYSILLVTLLGLAGVYQNTDSNANSTKESFSQVSKSKSSIEDAFAKHQSNLQVKASGLVSKILRDDTKGHKHQKFILRLASNHTVLIAHNIDLAPRVKDLKKGDRVEFYGEYEYNKRGGVIHWTHHDSKKRHVDGWLKHKNKIYQ